MSQSVLLFNDEGSVAQQLWCERGPASAWRADQLGPSNPEKLPRIAVLLIGDGRDELRRCTVQSFLDQVYGYQLTGVAQVDDRRHEMGFGGAIRAGWHYLRQQELTSVELRGERSFDYVFHLEEDWEFLEPIDVRWLVAILDGDNREQGASRPAVPVPSGSPGIDFPRIAQAALRRGAVNAIERAAGGVVEQWPESYLDAGVITEQGATPYLQHRLFFTTNPSLYRAELMMLGWPDGERSEAAFTQELLSWGYAFAYYGRREQAPLVEHLGVHRAGHGY